MSQYLKKGANKKQLQGTICTLMQEKQKLEEDLALATQSDGQAGKVTPCSVL